MINHTTSHPKQRAVGIFRTQEQVESALRSLKKANFDMDQVSVIARDSDQSPAGVAREDKDRQISEGNKADEGARTGAATGGVLGGLTGLLVGLGALAIPGIGPILLAGAGATALATTLAGTAIGAAAGGLVGGLVGLGIPEEHARVYSDHVAQGYYLVMLTGDHSSIDHAATILKKHGIQEWNVYNLSVSETTDQNLTVSDTSDQTITSDHPQVVIVDHRHQTHPHHDSSEIIDR